MNTQQLVRLWNEFCDEDMGEHTFKRFMDWLQDKDTTPNPHRYQESHVEGRRYACLTKTQILELIDEIDPTRASEAITKVRKRVEEL